MTVDDVRSLIGRVQAAINAHDLEAFLACFEEAYDSRCGRSTRSAVAKACAGTGRQTSRASQISAGTRSTRISAPTRLGASGGGTARASTGRGSIARLRAEGALTKSEFEAVKARLLSDEASA
jgi:hypothetical protein